MSPDPSQRFVDILKLDSIYLCGILMTSLMREFMDNRPPQRKATIWIGQVRSGINVWAKKNFVIDFGIVGIIQRPKSCPPAIIFCVSRPIKIIEGRYDLALTAVVKRRRSPAMQQGPLFLRQDDFQYQPNPALRSRQSNAEPWQQPL